MFAHQHFRAKTYASPRTAWALDYYGCERITSDYVNILGTIDLVTSEFRLFATKRRTGSITTDAILRLSANDRTHMEHNNTQHHGRFPV